MTLPTLTNRTPVIPDARESALARISGEQLATLLDDETEIRFKILEAPGGTAVLELPISALRLLVDILAAMAEGNPVTVMPFQAELTTQQAADVLGMSRPHLVKLLEERQIPFRKVGTHRRVRFQDVHAYKKRIDADRREVLRELAEEAQELDLGY